MGQPGDQTQLAWVHERQVLPDQSHWVGWIIKESTGNHLPLEFFIGGHNTLNLAVQPIFSLPQNPFTHFMLHWQSYYNATETFVKGFIDIMVNNGWHRVLTEDSRHFFPEGRKTGQT